MVVLHRDPAPLRPVALRDLPADLGHHAAKLIAFLILQGKHFAYWRQLVFAEHFSRQLGYRAVVPFTISVCSRQLKVSSIPFALRNLKWFLENKAIPIRLPELQKVLEAMVDDKIIRRFENAKATPESKLTVSINSFSYKKGLPEDASGNGGGFTFDCRGLLNPGRFEKYKSLTGRDKSVQDFLMYQTEMPVFLQHVYSLVDISVNDYLKRNFENLQINFGCTGGQHRSVFAADSLAKHLQQKFGCNVTVKHIVQEEKNWVN